MMDNGFPVFFVGLWCVMALVGLAVAAFWIWMLIDCAIHEPSTGNDKIVWILIIALTQVIGALIYFFVRRPQRIEQHGH